MKIRMILSILGLMGVQWIYAQDPDSSTALWRVAESERNFSRMSVAIGRRNAFLENLSEDCVVFQPEPMNGRKVYQERKPTPVLLTWEPEFVDVSASEDFGISTGPWEMSDFGPQHRPTRWGYYVSIWKKQLDGSWKVAVDMGSGVEEKSQQPVHLVYPKNSAAERTFKTIDKTKAKADLIKQDTEFDKTYSIDRKTDTYINFLTADARLLRMGHYPAAIPDSIRDALNRAEQLSWKPIDGDVANSGDLGYTYGSYSMKKETGQYLHVWRRENNAWKLLIDVQLPKD